MVRFGSVVFLGAALLVLLLLPPPKNAALSSPSGPHIAEVNILLPPKMTNPVEYRLQGSDGCFTWSWDHHDILSVVPEYNLSSHCSTSAHLKSIAPYSGRKETAVYATDVQTGMVIRCKVYIDNFSRIQIFHHSIKLDLEGLTTLRVRAFDTEDNEFSSLVGLRFMWQLRPEIDGLPHHLVHVPLKDSPLSDCGGMCGALNVRTRLEDNGEFSDLLIVKGIEIGQESVSVHLLEPLYEHMVDNIVLTVAEAMSLDPPSPVLVLVGAVVHFTLKVIRGNIPQMVHLPSTHHQWSVLNSSVAQVDAREGIAYAVNLGVTTISVEDTRVAGHVQMSSFHVVVPDILSLYLLPLSLTGDRVEGVSSVPSGVRWFVISGRDYVVHMRVFSGGLPAQEIYITENDDIQLHDDHPEYWNTVPLSSDKFFLHNGWWNSRVLKAKSFGLGELIATLTYPSGHDGRKEVLRTSQEVMVCDQVKIILDEKAVSHSILLPWAPSVYQEVELKSIGGCGSSYSDYRWLSSDIATVSVSISGVIQAKRPGNATIKVMSVYDSLNYDEVVIEVSIPSSMIMLPNFPVEIVVGSHIRASVTLQASDGAPFYKCDAFNSIIKWRTGSSAFVIVNTTRKSLALDEQESYSSLYDPPCAWTLVHASSSGRTLLHAAVTKEYPDFDPYVSGSINLIASSHIASYPPLVVHQAGNGNQFGGYWFDLNQAKAQNQLENLDLLYLAPGTQMDVMLSGGPEPWDGDVEFIESVETLGQEGIHLEDTVIVHKTVMDSLYRVSCLEEGTFKLVFRRGNLVGKDHPHPSVAVVEMLLTCSFPSSIVLIADEAVNTHDIIKTQIEARYSSPHVRSVPITVANGHTIRVSVVGISDSGQAFGNSSSVQLKWDISNCDGLAVWDDSCSLNWTTSCWERFLALQNSSGLCIIRATTVGLTTTLTDAIPLKIVSKLRVNPEFSLLYYSPDAVLNLSIAGGSCFLNFTVNDTQTVEVNPPAPELQCLQLVLAPKRLGTVLVSVRDMGISPPLIASSVVQVADIEWIKMFSGDDISLIEGSSLSIDLLAGVQDGRTFDTSQYAFMNIAVQIEDDIIELVDNNDFSKPVNGYVKAPNFVIHAKRLGVTTLYLSARQQSGLELRSQPIQIEVYATPSIHPSHIFLAPGASYVLSVIGGPTIGAHIEYESINGETAVVDKSSGKLYAMKPGNTTLIAGFYRNGDRIICQAHGEVTVGVPSSAMLDVQSTQLAVDREMPIFPSFSKGNLFSFYELCKDYEWTISDDNALEFVESEPSQSNKLDIRFGENNLEFIQVLHGKSAGKSDISVSFTCDFFSGSFSHSRSYNASVSVWVVSDLPLALGVPATWILPPHYTTSDLLPSSSSLPSKGDSHSHKDNVKYSLLKEFSAKNEQVQDDGISIHGGKVKTGESNHLACIQAKDILTGRTEVASCVRVAEVSQIRINTKGFPFLRSISLGVGSELDLPLTYCDDLGNPFHEAYNITLSIVDTCNRDVVLIKTENANIHLKAMRQGRALVQVSLTTSPQKSDCVLISVGAHLYPENPVLSLGSRVNFSVQGLNDEAFGHWSSSNTSVLSIHVSSGKAKASGEGTADVVFEGSGLKLQTRVSVTNGNIVLVEAPREKLLTNAPLRAEGYSFTVRFGDASNAYDCKVDPPFVGYAKPWKDLDTGNSYCLFFPHSPEHLVLTVPKLKDIPVSVSVSASLRGASHISGSASAPFVGGFSILGLDSKSLQINLTPELNKSSFTVVGNTDTEVHWKERGKDDLLRIIPVHRDGGRAEYEVRVVRDEERSRKKVIVITLPENGQRQEIVVMYEPRGMSRVLAKPSKVALWGTVVGGLAVLMVTVALFICFLDRPERAQPTAATFAATPIVRGPETPERRSSIGAGAKEQSPRTPQPFVEYLRRTIDETPYYRQDARRRFNPQNTL